jgi:hypothetical protein
MALYIYLSQAETVHIYTLNDRILITHILAVYGVLSLTPIETTLREAILPTMKTFLLY